MNNTTYLLGAGASANTIPIVNQIGQRLKEVLFFLEKYRYSENNLKERDKWPQHLHDFNSLIQKIIDDFNWLIEVSSKHQTIDTLAKKYYLTNDINLIRLKKTLIQYFIIEQVLFLESNPSKDYKFIKSKEYRYDSFFAALFEKNGKKLRVNPRVKIVSWNYDQQIELALSSYSNSRLTSIKEEFQVLPNESTYFNDSAIRFDLSSFGCLKINGNAVWCPLPVNGVDSRYSALDYSNREGFNHELLLGEVLYEIEQMKNINGVDHIQNSIRQLNFSWEDDDDFTEKYKGFNTHRQLLSSIAKTTETLVIIGYSFPIFNRSVDKQFFENLDNVKKVYIQDPNCEEVWSLIEKGFEVFKKRRKVGVDLEFVLEKNTSQFIIPPELL
jgi:hypothetical protein